VNTPSCVNSSTVPCIASRVLIVLSYLGLVIIALKILPRILELDKDSLTLSNSFRICIDREYILSVDSLFCIQIF
jgi:hypothetical protein